MFSLLFALTMCFSNVTSASVKADKFPGVEMVAIVTTSPTSEVTANVNAELIVFSESINPATIISDWPCKYTTTIFNTTAINSSATLNSLYTFKESCWRQTNVNYINKTITAEPKHIHIFRGPRDALRVI